MSGPRLRVSAPAKINLHLEVLRLRGDGYHEVRTILQSIALADTLTVTERPGPFTVRSRTASMPSDRDNLVWTAGAALWSALGRRGEPSGVAVAVRKVVPAGAGLGGASSDAASALRALAQLWAPRAPARLLREVAAAIGSDVPFFLEGGTVLAAGRGERLRRLAPAGPYAVVIASPAFGVSTPDAYRWWDEDATVRQPPPKVRRPPGRHFSAGVDAGGPGVDAGASAGLPRGWRSRPDRLWNDLEGPVSDRHPAIADMVRRLEASGAIRAGMTGSGSAVIGLYASAAAAERARRSARLKGWRTWRNRTTDAAAHARLTAVARVR
ncbi:MAG: 4-(cytidine 5'-diphospho)-2-C-methyl-D-erythritol kinase [Acidobacteria bacterium]|nr:4-(cytidine 5'-diphospho)-2-C-methyl-D-erythritol kinase [Acidobacteriota bacterium]